MSRRVRRAKPFATLAVQALGRRVQRVARWSVVHPALAAGCLALLARVGVAVGSFVVHDGFLIPDERQYVELARFVASGRGAEAWVPGYGQALYDTTWTFTAPLALFYDVLGPSRLVGQLWAASFGVATTVLTARLACEVVDRHWALVAGVIVAAMPSQVLWSSVVLREAPVWAALAALGLVVALARRASGREAWLLAAAVIIALLALAYLREQTFLAAAWALPLAALLGAEHGRLVRIGTALVVAIVIPMAVGDGPAGYDVVAKAAPQLGTRRVELGLGAESAITPTTVLEEGGGEPGGEERVSGDARRDVVEDDSGTLYVVEEGVAAHIGHLPRGLPATMFRPYPWESTAGTGTHLARVENVLWYALYAFALLGMLVGWSRRRALAYPVSVAAVVLGIAFVTQGNVGTAFRHRAQILWVVALLAVVGAARVVEWLRSRQLGSPAVCAEDRIWEGA